MHILAVNLFMQESDNLAPDAVEGISSWYLAKQSLPVVFKAVHPAFEIPVFVFTQKVNPSASSLLFLSWWPQMLKTSQSEKSGVFYSLIEISAKRPCYCLRTWINWEVKTNVKTQQKTEQSAKWEYSKIIEERQPSCQQCNSVLDNPLWAIFSNSNQLCLSED